MTGNEIKKREKDKGEREQTEDRKMKKVSVEQAQYSSNIFNDYSALKDI